MPIYASLSPANSPALAFLTLKYRMTLVLFQLQARHKAKLWLSPLFWPLYTTKGQKAHPHKCVQADGHPVGQQLLYHCFRPEREHEVGLRLVTGVRCRAGRDLEIKITPTEKRAH